MTEVAVAFPNDEATAEVIASRLRIDGVPARVDRGLHGSSRQVSARGHITVLVDERDAAKAHGILGTKPVAARPPSPFERVAVLLLVIAVVVGIAAIVALAVTR